VESLGFLCLGSTGLLTGMPTFPDVDVTPPSCCLGLLLDRYSGLPFPAKVSSTILRMFRELFTSLLLYHTTRPSLFSLLLEVEATTTSSLETSPIYYQPAIPTPSTSPADTSHPAASAAVAAAVVVALL